MAKLRACFPEVRLLFRAPYEGDDWESPYEGMEDTWVRIVPPDWQTATLRQRILAGEVATPLDTVQLDIFLCYGGTNFLMDIPLKNEQGRLVWTDEGLAVEEITFDELGQLSMQEFFERIEKVPQHVVEYWYARTLDVVPEWAEL